MERNSLLTRQGIPQADRLVEHQGWLHGLARELIADTSHAEDVVQETLLAALSRGQRPHRPVPWLKTVLRNCVRQHHRSRIRRRRREEKAARPERVVAGTDRVCEQEELRALLRRLVASLREPYRSTVLLHYFGEIPLEEIARRQGLASATVRTRLRRALGELRRRVPAKERLLGAGVFAGSLRAAGADAAVRSGARATTAKLSSSLSIGGVMQIGTKSVVLAFAVSAGVFATLTGLYLLDHDGDERVARPAQAVMGSMIPAGTNDRTHRLSTSTGSERPTNEPNATSRNAELPVSRGSPESPAGQPLTTARTALEPATGAVLALRNEFDTLRRLFRDGGNGWKLVGDNIVRVRQLITETDEGFEEFLALVDDEKDGEFLEAVLHHLPLRSGSAFQREITNDEELHAELWARFEEEPDAYRRRSLLRFFCYNPALSRGRMKEFGDIARSDASPLVRGLGLDAISSADYPKSTWPALCDIAEHDGDESLRAEAIRGLATADSERARAIYRSAFSSDSEAIRAAAVRGHLDEGPPPEAVGGDYASYLVGEFRRASTSEYRQVLIDRLLAVAPMTLLHEADRALRSETDRPIKHQYRKAIEAAESRLRPRG